jgi:three-Cys-motif partner protein
VVAKQRKFFEAQKEASRIKSAIVVKYFQAWARVMVPQVRSKANPRLLYLDLFCGPGKYEDGSQSTPLLILAHAIATAELRDMIVALFNDADAERTEELGKHIDALPGIEKLKHKPRIRTAEVNVELVAELANVNMVPAFSFIDPFGYKGLSLELVDVLMKGWGSDMVLFFPFSRINAALTNKKVAHHVDALFGPKRAERLRELASDAKTEEREKLVVEEFAGALADRGYEWIIPYVFESVEADRTSHYLIFVSKHRLGYSIMKDIMYKESQNRNQGVARFGHVRSVSKKRTPLLELLNRPLDELCDELCELFAGQSMTMKRLFERHQDMLKINPFVPKNYKEALNQLDAQKRITASKPKRPPGTFGDSIVVTFPAMEKK